MLSMAPNIVFAPNIRRTQNTDTGRKTQTQCCDIGQTCIGKDVKMTYFLE